MPSDLIYREDAKDYARHAIAKGLNVLEYLDEVPAADFRPVVRGRWDDKPVAFFFKCSECGCCVGHRDDVFLDRGKLNYCPNCGADMREES